MWLRSRERWRQRHSALGAAIRAIRSPGAWRAASALGLVLALAAAGCSPYKPFDTAAFVHEQYTRRVRPEDLPGVVVPFQINDEVRAEFRKLGRRESGNEEHKVTQVVGFIFDDLGLKYSLTPTRDAVATFRTRHGNCLSFVNLFVGLARDVGLNPFYVEVTDYQTWNHREGMVVSQGHIVGGMYLTGDLRTYDFLPYRPKAYKQFKPIDDLTAVAHFYNNLGAEALLAGDLPQAIHLLGIANQIAPRFEKSLNNLGVCKARSGDYEGALALYRKGLETDPADTMIMTNMSRAYQQLGRVDEANALLAKVEASNTTNPFFFVYEGDMALARGDTQKALDYMVRALRLDSEVPEVHVGLMKVYLALGDVEKAKHFLERALKLDANDREARRYAYLLGK
jgi:tetratricopeptide (TPR) repeat protein